MQILYDRRALHRIPELDHTLPETLAYLETALKDLSCRVFSPMAGALCAFFDFGRETALAFRADMDALPIAERTGADYASAHPGKMHACGHDGHMAILLELARRLDAKQENPRNILLVFQPAEETTGGARLICETGVFQEYQVDAMFGLHLWPGLERGSISTRAGELMARCCDVNVDIHGRSAHIAKSHLGLDALAAGAEFYRRAVQMEQAIPDGVYRLLKFGKFESGTVRNALSAHTRLEGSLRTFQDDLFGTMQDSLLAIGRDIEAETGCRVTVAMSPGYPAVINPRPLFDRVKASVPFDELDAPYMTAEDFAFYQRYVPALFFFLGIGDTPPLHADTFDFDDSVLTKGADFFEFLATNLR